MSQTHPTYALGYRPDIDGLRALAILPVIIFHAFPKFLRGGFIGVDIFFVISGYLITGIILRQQQRQQFSLLDFYSRRIKRIFPALTVVLLFCMGAGWLTLLNQEYAVLGTHIAAGAVYTSNFLLHSESGYFNTASDLKPLLHLWSLSIEEQFYLLFPCLLLLAHRFRFTPLVIILAGLGMSLLYELWLMPQDATGAFFFPQSRAWELLIGSSVAYCHSQPRTAFSQRSANSLSLLGLTAILLAWVWFDSQKIAFPSAWALLPTLGAASLILAGEAAWFNRQVLSSQVARAIGVISYPLYLWHWVLLSFLRITEMDKPSGSIRSATLLLSVLLAWATYQCVEKNLRFRQSPWVSIGLLLSLLFIGAGGYGITLQQGFPERYQLTANWREGDIGNDVYKQQGWIAQAACVEQYTQIPFAEFPDDQFCLIQHPEQAPTAVLLGDSHANHLYAGLSNATAFTGGNLLNIGGGGCFPVYDNPLQPNAKCRALLNQSLDWIINAPNIHTVLLSSRAITALNEKSFLPKHQSFSDPNAANEQDPYNVFERGLQKTLPKLLAAHKRVIFIQDIPDLEFELAACINRPWRLSGQTAKQPCAAPRAQVTARQEKYVAMLNRSLHAFPEVAVLDPLPALCDADHCWAIKNDTLLYRDDNHLNAAGSVYLGEYLQKQAWRQ